MKMRGCIVVCAFLLISAAASFAGAPFAATAQNVPKEAVPAAQAAAPVEAAQPVEAAAPVEAAQAAAPVEAAQAAAPVDPVPSSDIPKPEAKKVEDVVSVPVENKASDPVKPDVKIPEVKVESIIREQPEVKIPEVKVESIIREQERKEIPPFPQRFPNNGPRPHPFNNAQSNVVVRFPRMSRVHQQAVRVNPEELIQIELEDAMIPMYRWRLVDKPTSAASIDPKASQRSEPSPNGIIHVVSSYNEPSGAAENIGGMRGGRMPPWAESEARARFLADRARAGGGRPEDPAFRGRPDGMSGGDPSDPFANPQAGPRPDGDGPRPFGPGDAHLASMPPHIRAHHMEMEARMAAMRGSRPGPDGRPMDPRAASMMRGMPTDPAYPYGSAPDGAAPYSGPGGRPWGGPRDPRDPRDHPYPYGPTGGPMGGPVAGGGPTGVSVFVVKADKEGSASLTFEYVAESFPGVPTPAAGGPGAADFAAAAGPAGPADPSMRAGGPRGPVDPKLRAWAASAVQTQSVTVEITVKAKGTPDEL